MKALLKGFQRKKPTAAADSTTGSKHGGASDAPSTATSDDTTDNKHGSTLMTGAGLTVP